ALIHMSSCASRIPPARSSSRFPYTALFRSFKLRAEEGRCIHQVDISMFISNLPSGTDTRNFVTENASGSTSQAANTVEALAGGKSEEHTSELQSRFDLVCRLLLEKKNKTTS